MGTSLNPLMQVVEELLDPRFADEVSFRKHTRLDRAECRHFDPLKETAPQGRSQRQFPNSPIQALSKKISQIART